MEAGAAFPPRSEARDVSDPSRGAVREARKVGSGWIAFAGSYSDDHRAC